MGQVYAFFPAAALQLEVTAMKAGRINAPKIQSQVKQTIEQLNRIISDIRKYIFRLGPVRTGEMDIYQYLQQTAEEFMAGGEIDTTIKVEGKRVELSPDQQQDLAFIVHEALSNVIKHAAASTVKLEMLFQEDSLLVKIEENGVGLGIPETPGTAGQGLQSMAKRAEVMGAALSVCGGADGGTVVSLKIPYNEKKKLNQYGQTA